LRHTRSQNTMVVYFPRSNRGLNMKILTKRETLTTVAKQNRPTMQDSRWLPTIGNSDVGQN